MKSLVVFALLLASAANAQVASHSSTGATNSSSAPGPNTSAFQVSDKAVARVNGAVLTDRDLLREMLQIFPYANQHNGFPKAQEASIRQGALQMIIFEELVYQDALRRKLIVPTAELKQSEAEFKKQFKSADEYQQYLKTEMGGSEQIVRNKIKRSLLIEQVLKTDVESKSAMTWSEVKAYYEKNPDEIPSPRIVCLSIHFRSAATKAQRGSKKQSLKRANEALIQAKKTTSAQDFGLLAEKISEDDFRVNMGDHKAVDKDKLPPQVVKALLGMKPGQVSDLIQIDQAYTIVRLNAHTMAKKQSYEEVKGQLRTELQKSKYEQLRAALNKRLRASAKVEVL